MSGYDILADNSGRWLVLAATSRASAERYVSERRLAVGQIVDRVEVARVRGKLAALAAASGSRRILLHSSDWSREEMPQLYWLALARSSVVPAALVDEAASLEPVPLGSGAVAREAVAVLPQCGFALGRSGVEVARAIFPRRSTEWRPSGVDAVIATWSGSGGSEVGGSVTHAAGVLGAFSNLGLAVHLVSDGEPPTQVRDAVRTVEVLPPLPPAQRSVREVRRLAGNRQLRRHLGHAARRFASPFIYSRHQAMSIAPGEVARQLGIPSVLEWNASERWALEHWTRLPDPAKRVLAPIVETMERRALGDATAVAAVSEVAGEMARGAGAAAERVFVVPNAVDVDRIDDVVAGCRSPTSTSATTVGWVGTFGEWHGAGLLVEAVAASRTRPKTVMIGDGIERARCEALARRLGVDREVEFLGRLPHDDALRRLAACDVLAAPNLPLRTGEPFFGSPTKVFEYMALAKAVVASDLDQIGDVLEDGTTALLFRPGSVAGLRDALDRLIEDPALRSSLSRKARAAAEDRHRWTHRAKSILSAVATA